MSSDTRFCKYSSLTAWLTVGLTATALVAFTFYPRANNEPTSSNSNNDQHEQLARSKRSPLVSSSSSFMEGSTGAANLFMINRFTEMNHEDNFMNEITHEVNKCRKRSLPMCSGQVPFNSTVYPNFIGDSNELEASRSLPYFNYIAKSRCNRRIKQLLCAFLEPDCSNGRPLPPCKKFCRIALEGCAEFIPQTLELSSAFDCRRYPDSTDPRVCVNLAMGPKCATDEFQCPDRSCIPRHWVCDGVRDCIFAADEANCNTVACSSEEFECDRKCVPASWRCDGDRDCADGTDELNCSYRPGCGPDRFRCADGFGCIPKRWVCDGKAECRDGSDEMGCSQKECTQGDFKCDSGICIPGIWVCDGQDDCKDNSDERSCSATSLTARQDSGPIHHLPQSQPQAQQQQQQQQQHHQHQHQQPQQSQQQQHHHQQQNQQSHLTQKHQNQPQQAAASSPVHVVVPAASSYSMSSSPQPSYHYTPSYNHQYTSNSNSRQQQAQAAAAVAAASGAGRFINQFTRSPVYQTRTFGTSPSFATSSFAPATNSFRRISHVQPPLNHPFFGHSNQHVYRYFPLK